MDLPRALEASRQVWRSDVVDLRTRTDRLISDSKVDSDARFVVDAAVVALVARFQRGCLDLITIAAGSLRTSVRAEIGDVLERALLLDLRISRGNATAGALRADLRRFGIDFLEALLRFRPSQPQLRAELEDVHAIRNAVAHGDSNSPIPIALADLDVMVDTLDAVLDVIASALHERVEPLTTQP